MGTLQLIVCLLLLSCCAMRRSRAAYEDVAIDLNDDILGLIVFKSELHNPPALSSWTEDDGSPCSWKFIQCNSATGRVSGVYLTGLDLSGRLGKGLQKLQGLKVLSISNNNLTGELRPELAQLPNLETLDLSHNKFTGQLPSSFSSLGSSLRYLDLSQNMLSGPLPDNVFQNFPSLSYLSLSGNSFQGPIPSTLSKCSVLNGLNLSNNHFSGNPFIQNGGIFALNRLRLLDLSNNLLSGNIPTGIYTLHNLKELHLQGNQFSGSIPSDISLCPHLLKLDLNSNFFAGNIPTTFGTLKSLVFLNLAHNTLNGEFPQWVGNLTNLQHLDVSDNGLTGVLPMSMGDLKSLKSLILSNNKITGNLPTSVVQCNGLKTLQLKGNLFNGSIPERLFTMGLEEIGLSENRFTGSIPPASGQVFESLLVLDLSNNDLSGEIPPEMGLFSSLRYLNLSRNNLHSRIPPEIGYLQNLTVLDIRGSALYGMIPGDLCDSSSSLSILQLDDNSLTGPIPQEIGNCSSLYLLSLSHNNLSGPIPSSMSMLKGLEFLRLESNELSGEMPKELGTMQNLLAANVSYNKLIGRLPPGGVFPSLDASALQGNLGLCSPLLKGPCKLNVQKPLVLDPNAYPNSMHGHNEGNEIARRLDHHKFLSISAIIAIAAAAIIVIGVIIITLLNASARRRLAFIDNALESIFSSSSRSGTPSVGRLVLFDTRTSGNLFADPESLINKASEIGGGLFGIVYKATIGAEGRIVAVKKLYKSNILQYPEDFDREVRALGKVRHLNVASLRGYYWTPQLQLLVSDYATNGSLQFRLHERPLNLAPLSWDTRFRILLGTAKGLAHLHHSCSPPIIHYNLKPSNILLDENYNAKVSDFGLARLLTRFDNHSIAGNRFQGAPGYAAPELVCQSLRVDEKCDVYSFGIMVLEIITGRRPIEYGEDNVVILNDHVRVLLEEGNVLDCVDHSMGEYPDGEVLPVLKVALVCTSQVPSIRPSMSEVVQILQVIKTPVPQRQEGY
ncbi:probably inactive leucine-rich repeat receptor-like protein kinase At3g28040 [Chenopodium quinoa]|uniref:non-specific serine/threonine protein kinase n=1 Tax=Chenopodium quinoa TaxID=63459 RepID=A0A803LTE3_CHEQI|nr:probably inactive leucine-rich repeat receptor-like protein kinase At3g28040 [Chenopodium quinoa]